MFRVRVPKPVLTVVGIRRAGGQWELVDEDTIVYPEDEIIVAGGTEGIERLTTRG
ncbi:hypothetical protein [Brevibacterium samyangense]|uniref:RCK C-terminal domain-containing protein n=1 Tax=Brevibacterium samyangense TaxID=366888 RepID=A0ABP5ERW3_9MICO